MRTGSIAITTGVYRSDCSCQFFARVPRGEEAPHCPLCLRTVGWDFVRPDYTPVPVEQSSADTPRRAP
jgi:hypothetical protein